MLIVGKQYQHATRGRVTVLAITDGKGATEVQQGSGAWVTLRLDELVGNILKQRLDVDKFAEVAA